MVVMMRFMNQPERKSFPELLSAIPPQDRGDLSVLRPLFEEFMLQTPLPSNVSLTETKLGGVLALEISMPEATTDAALLYFHGGVFALGSARASAGLACLIARQARATVLYSPWLDMTLAGASMKSKAAVDVVLAPDRLRVLLDDATRLAVAVAAANVAVQLDVTPEVGHVFQASAPELDEADAALARTGAFLGAYLQLVD